MTHIRFNLTEMDRGGAISTSFSGRSEGREVRKVHELDKKMGMVVSMTFIFLVTQPQSILLSSLDFLFKHKKLGMEKFKKNMCSVMMTFKTVYVMSFEVMSRSVLLEHRMS